MNFFLNLFQKILEHDICKFAVEKDGFNIQYVPENLKTLEICKIAVEQNIEAIPLVPENLRLAELNKEEFSLEFVLENYEHTAAAL